MALRNIVLCIASANGDTLHLYYTHNHTHTNISESVLSARTLVKKLVCVINVAIKLQRSLALDTVLVFKVAFDLRS